MAESLFIFIVDASENAVRSEDFGGYLSRFQFQKECIGQDWQANARSLNRSLKAKKQEASGTVEELKLHILPESGVMTPAQIAIVVTCRGKASVALGPTSNVETWLDALDKLPSGGEANLPAALSLACLVARSGTDPRIIAFLAGPTAFSDQDAVSLKSRLNNQNVKLSVSSLAPRSEVGAFAAEALESLLSDGIHWAHASLEKKESEDEFSDDEYEEEEESLEEHLWKLREQFAEESSLPHFIPAPESISVKSAAARSLINGKKPNNLAAAQQAANSLFDSQKKGTGGTGPLSRSGVTCREGSLDVLLMHSRSGMLRSKLPTYSTMAQRLQRHAQEGGGDYYHFRVLAQPRYRTVVKISASSVRSKKDQAQGHQYLERGAAGVLRILQDLNNPKSCMIAWTSEEAETRRLSASAAPENQQQQSAGASSSSAASSTFPPTNGTDSDAPFNMFTGSSSNPLTLMKSDGSPAQNPIVMNGIEYWVQGYSSNIMYGRNLDAGELIGAYPAHVMPGGGQLISFGKARKDTTATGTQGSLAGAAAAAAQPGPNGAAKPQAQWAMPESQFSRSSAAAGMATSSSTSSSSKPAAAAIAFWLPPSPEEARVAMQTAELLQKRLFNPCREKHRYGQKLSDTSDASMMKRMMWRLCYLYYLALIYVQSLSIVATMITPHAIFLAAYLISFLVFFAFRCCQTLAKGAGMFLPNTRTAALEHPGPVESSSTSTTNAAAAASSSQQMPPPTGASAAASAPSSLRYTMQMGMYDAPLTGQRITVQLPITNTFLSNLPSKLHPTIINRILKSPPPVALDHVLHEFRSSEHGVAYLGPVHPDLVAAIIKQRALAENKSVEQLRREFLARSQDFRAAAMMTNMTAAAHVSAPAAAESASNNAAAASCPCDGPKSAVNPAAGLQKSAVSAALAAADGTPAAAPTDATAPAVQILHGSCDAPEPCRATADDVKDGVAAPVIDASQPEAENPAVVTRPPPPQPSDAAN